MDNLSLFTLLLACATFLLAGASFWIIFQNYKFKEKDRKERLLNEIIEWAKDSYKCGVDNSTMERGENLVARYNDKPLYDEKKLSSELRYYSFLDKSQLETGYTLIKRDGLYISSVVRVFESDLQNAVNELCVAIGNHTDLLDSWQGTFTQPNKDSSEVVDRQKLEKIDLLIIDNKKRIHSLSCEVIEEAVKTKIRKFS